jgi:hypothetical protein
MRSRDFEVHLFGGKALKVKCACRPLLGADRLDRGKKRFLPARLNGCPSVGGSRDGGQINDAFRVLGPKSGAWAVSSEFVSECHGR